MNAVPFWRIHFKGLWSFLGFFWFVALRLGLVKKISHAVSKMINAFSWTFICAHAYWYWRRTAKASITSANLAATYISFYATGFSHGFFENQCEVFPEAFRH